MTNSYARSDSELQAIFVSGFAFSGTTLLNFMLGAHDEIFATGEAFQIFPRYRENREAQELMVSCSMHQADCDFWTPDFLKQCEEGDMALVHARVDAYAPYCRFVAHKTSIDTLPQLLAEGIPTAALIVPFKRPAAYCYSARTHFPGQDLGACLRHYSTVGSKLLAIMETPTFPVIPVFYEELATDPAAVMERICDSAELEPIETMLEPWQRAADFHTIGGNAGTFMHFWPEHIREGVLRSAYWDEQHGGERHEKWVRENFRTIKLDEKWREMAPDDIRAVEADEATSTLFARLLALSEAA